MFGRTGLKLSIKHFSMKRLTQNTTVDGVQIPHRNDTFEGDFLHVYTN